MSEEWKVIPGYEGRYEASNTGRIRGIHRPTPQIMKPYMKRGYFRIELRKDGASHDEGVHRLVCMAWNSPPPNGMECCHINGIRTDNRPENLMWATHAENVSHKQIHGTERKGEDKPQAILTEAQVVKMRRLRSEGWEVKRIAESMGVPVTAAGQAITGRKWKHLDNAQPTQRRLNDEEIVEIRRARREERLSFPELGKRFNITTAGARFVVRGITHPHLPGIETAEEDPSSKLNRRSS